MISTIVVPLDGSELAERALPYARGLAARKGATVLLVSAVEIPAEFTAWTTAGAAMGREMDEWVTDREQYLVTIAGSFGNTPVRHVVSLSGAATAIIDAIGSAANPLLVMASHGRSGAKRFLLGSVASRVVHEVTCPVMLIRATAPEVPVDGTKPFAKVVVPLDGSAFGEHALDHAIDAVDDPATIVHLIRVIEAPSLPLFGADDPGVTLDYGLVAEYLDATRDEAREYLEKVAERLRAAGRTVTLEVRDGEVADQIIASADEQHADLIAMSTHGRGGLGRIFFGSVAERVLRDTHLPLLLIRPQEE